MTTTTPTGDFPQTVSANSIYIDPNSNNTLTTSGTTYTINGTSIIPNNTTIYSGYVNAYPSDPCITIQGYSISVEGETLVIKDKNGRECLSFKDGIPMIGGKTIHEVILDVIDMADGKMAMTDLLVDPDAGKRALGKKIHERTKNKRRKSKKSSTTEE